MILQTKIQRKKLLGFTLIELLLTIALIIGLTTALVYTLASRASKASNFTQMGAEMTEIATAERAYIRDASAGNGEATSDFTGLIEYGLSKDIAEHPEHANPFGGGYTVVASTDDAAFVVTANGLPASFNDTSDAGYNQIKKQLETLGESAQGVENACLIQKDSTGSKSNAMELACTVDNG